MLIANIFNTDITFTHFQDTDPIATRWGTKWKLFFMPALWLSVVWNSHCVPSLPASSSGKGFLIFHTWNSFVLLNLPCVSYACFQSYREYFIIYSYADLSVYEHIIKLSIHVSAGGTSSFLWSYCKPMCVMWFSCGIGCRGLRMNCAAGKAKPVKFYPPSS